MEQNVTTPFGRRRMTLGMLATQLSVQNTAVEASVDKWKLFRALCEARTAIGISDRALSVLNALLSFHPAAELSEQQGLVVFPSNAQLSMRAHGMAPSTLRRHLADLVDAGLIIRKDSPNGKRYARKTSGGEIDQAFGFSLAPLLMRAAEIEQAAEQIRAEQRYLRSLRERITLCRRDIAKLIEAGLEEGLVGNWLGLYERFRAIIMGIARTAGAVELDAAANELANLRSEVLNMLEQNVKTQNPSAKESQKERHKQNSNTDSRYELEPALEKKQAATSNPPADVASVVVVGRIEKATEPAKRRPPDLPATPAVKPFPLALVLRACPQIADYGPGGSIGSWRDCMSAAVVVRSMLGVSPSAYEQACEVMGPENAATVIACILERAEHINSAGGYLRDLTRRAERGEFGLGPMLMALAKSHATRGLQAG